MRYSEARRGRTFVVRLDDGDVVHESIEQFAREKGILAASVILLGGADTQSKLVVGPEQARGGPPNPMEAALGDVHEIAGVGTIFPDEGGSPVLHMHAACGRQRDSVTGCVRAGVKVWHVGEVIIDELLDTSGVRRKDPRMGFALLEP
ncbi:MAG: DUF296 domain-containing protein [Chitinivibrionales bacterium]|nr:DUF296 domain-containing protein [Chitinivibrionales bacterium]